MPKAKITGSAPILLVKDVIKSAEYFKEKLGFSDQEFYGEPISFSIVRRDNHAVMLSQLDEGKTHPPHWQIVSNMWNVYFWVDDVEAIYEEFQNSGAIIDYTLGVKGYGVKEFGVQDLDDHDIAFGEILE